MLFSDVEGSTRLLDALGAERFAEVLELHRRLLRGAFEAHGGYEVDEEGDAFLVAFAAAADAIAAAAEAQQALQAAAWPEGVQLRVRMGVHSGEPLSVPPKYVGVDVHRAARIMAAAHGSQVLVSQTTAELLGDTCPLLDLGEHRLKDLSLPQRLFQLLVKGVPVEFPPVRTLENRPTNLPVQRTALLGRERELTELQELLLAPDVSIVSLTGPGGTGKTRLALQAAAELVEEFHNGVWFVSLSPLRDAELVVPTIARTLGLRDDPSRPAGEVLRSYLEDKRVLLLLDNFEHVAESAAAVADACGAARVKLLATSRSPLRLSGEHVFPVPPLGLPDPGEDLAALSESAAVALFVERAVTAGRDFALSEANAASVVELCARLDGLPLAIELAAARTRVLPPQAILARLSDRFDLLTGGARDLEDRQQTLRATLDWSYELLSAEQQRLFARLSVFTGGCRLDAGEAVCADDEMSTVEGIIALVEQSLLRERDDFDGDPRFWMLESIRAYGAERLAHAGETDAVAAAHFDHFARFAREAEPHWRDPDEGRWLARFAGEIDNVRAALSHGRESGRAAAVLEMATNLGWLWQNGYVREGEELLRELRAAATSADPALLARAHAVELVLKSDHDLLDQDTETQEAVEACIAGGRRDIGEFLRMRLAGQYLMRGKTAQAEKLVELAEKAAAETGDPGIASAAVDVRVEIYKQQGRTDAARQVLASELELPYYRSNTNHLIALLGSLSSLELIEGDAEQAAAAAERSLRLARETNDRSGLPYALYNLAQAALLLGDLDGAAEYVQQADLMEREVRPPTETSTFLEEIRLTRAAIASARGDTELAQKERESALQFFADHELTVAGAEQLLLDRYLSE